VVYRQSLRLDLKPLETHNQRLFFNWSLAVIVLSDETMSCLLWVCLAFHHVYVSHIWRVIGNSSFALYVSPLSVQALQSRSCLS
jgi:hypothetical protein